MTTGLAQQAEILRSLHHGSTPLVLPNAWDVVSARAVERAGFPVVATSSAAVAESLGFEDADSMPVDAAFGAIDRVARAVSVPVTADFEAGYQLSLRTSSLVSLAPAPSAAISRTPTIMGRTFSYLWSSRPNGCGRCARQ